jgi:hypothetical protein
LRVSAAVLRAAIAAPVLSILAACGGGGVASQPVDVTLSGTFSASSLSVSERTRDALSVGSVGATIYAGPNASGAPFSTSCAPVSNGSATLSITAPVGIDTLALIATSGPCSSAAGGVGTTPTGTLVAQFTQTGKVIFGMTSLRDAFNAGAAITLSPLQIGAPSAVPSSVALNGTGAANAGTFVVNEPGFAGTLSESSTCGSVATVTPATATGPSATYTVTGTAAGTCTVTVSSPFGQTTVAVVVTTSGFGVTSNARGGVK